MFRKGTTVLGIAKTEIQFHRAEDSTITQEHSKSLTTDTEAH